MNAYTILVISYWKSRYYVGAF